MLVDEVAEKSGVTVACGFAGKVLGWILSWIGGEGVLGVVFGDWVAGEEVGCYFWGAILCGLREELAVLILEEGAEGREIFGGDGVEEWVVCRHPERKLHS